jgi:serine/threonine-protein kinase HipA
MRVAEVKLWKTRIGAVSIEANSPYCFFQYDPEFIKSGIECSPLKMPLSSAVFQFNTLSLDGFKGLPGLLADSLPDRFGNAIINAWLVASGRTVESFNIIERLCYIGSRGMGALEFYPDRNKAMNKQDGIEIDKLVELSNQIINRQESITIQDKDELKDIIKVGTSAGGARAKAIIAYHETTGHIKSGQIDAGQGYSYWILKLDGVDQKEESTHTRVEYAYYLMATSAKITMSESRLLSVGGRYHFMTKRFDRIILPDGTMDKLHMQTLGALMHVDYNEPGIMSYEEVTQIMYQLGLKQSDNEQFFRRMVFNVMSRNQDDHVKNISFIMNRKGQWSLSPAYDVTYAYNPNGKWTQEHQMLIHGKRSQFTKEDLLKSAQSMNIKESKAIKIIEEVKDSILNWRTFAKMAFVDEQTIDFIHQSHIIF